MTDTSTAAVMRLKMKEQIAPQLSEGIGAILRKFCDSHEALKARTALHAMPEGDWNTLIDMLSDAAADAAVRDLVPALLAERDALTARADAAEAALREAAAVATACERQNHARVSDSETHGIYRLGLEAAGQAIAAGILALLDKPAPDHSATPGNMVDKGAG